MSKPEFGSTKEIADIAGVKASAVHHSYCIKGHYLGIKPVKLPNRLLRWNLTEARKVLGLDSAEAE